MSYSTLVVVASPDKHFASSSKDGIKPTDRHDPAALSVFLQVLADIKPDIHVDLGDLAHFGYISHYQFEKGQFGRVPSQDGETIALSVADDNALINRWLDKLQGACRKDTKFHQLEGNHEEILRVGRNKEAYRPFVNSEWYPEKAWRLQERGIKWTPYQRYDQSPNPLNSVKIGKVRLIHGHYATANHLEKHWRSWGCSLIYGHMHTVEEKTFPTLEAQQVVKTIGCLCSKTASYHRGRNNAWAQAFSVIYIQPNGLFHESTVRIINGNAVWNGKVYHAKKMPGIE